jgi:Na+/proline symporter
LPNLSEEEAKRRFGIFALTRLSAVALVMGGIAVALTGVVRPGGWPLPGIAIGLIGVAEALVLPRLLRKRWDRE